MSNTHYFIVTFVDEDDAPGIIASNWLKPEENMCYYPNSRTEEMKDKLLRRMAEPDDTWPQYKVKILKPYETYGEARIHLKKAEETSNLDSDDEVKKRKRKRNKIYFPEDSNSSDDYPIVKVTKTQKILNAIKNYPTPPTPKSASMKNTTADTVKAKVSNNVAMEVISAVKRPCTSSAMTVLSDSNQEDECLPEFSPEVQNPATTSKQAYPSKCPSDCAISKQFAVQQCHLIQVVTDLSKQMMEVNRKVDLLLGRTEVSTEDACIIPEFLTNLPVKDDASFCDLDNQLKIIQNKQAIVKFLAGIGGRNVRTLTTNMLRRILLDDVAEQYSLTGKQMKNSTKKSFLATETCKIIFQICKKVYDVTEENLKEITSDWLNQAKVRITRRTERLRNKEPVSDAIAQALGLLS